MEKAKKEEGFLYQSYLGEKYYIKSGSQKSIGEIKVGKILLSMILKSLQQNFKMLILQI
jgi:hypothetical protein